MKYSNYIGIAAALGLVFICFQPWVFIASINTTLTGMDTANTSLGKPGLLNIIFSAISILLFLVTAVWSKRANLFIGAFNMAWAVRNYLLVTQCQMGECPEKKWAVYVMLLLSAIIMIMSMFPDGVVKSKTL